MLHRLCLLLLSIAAIVKAEMEPMIMRPSTADPGYTQAALIFAPGSGLAPSTYASIGEAIQRHAQLQFGIALWVAFPDFKNGGPFTMGQFRRGVAETVRIVSAKISASDVPFFYAGHSRGGIFIQDTVQEVLKEKADGVQNLDDDPLHLHPCRGLILFASALQRKYRQPGREQLISQLPIVTIGGELDGLFRVFRLAESFYHQRANQSTLLVRGASHMSFSSGPAPAFVKLLDLHAEVPQDESDKIIGEMTSTFLASQMELAQQSQAMQQLVRFQQQSAEYFAPILKALMLEGSYHLKPACNELSSEAAGSPCWRGSPWSQYTQTLMSALPENMKHVRLNSTDDFWKVWLIPVHIPKLEGDCKESSSAECTLNMKTITQCVYQPLDLIDSGFTPVACEEMRTKFVSRQWSHVAAGIKNASFADLDDNNFVCQKINERAWHWALENAPEDIMKRFRKNGVRLVMGEDMGPYNNGPNWIWYGLNFKKHHSTWLSTDWVEVRSPTMRTPLDFYIPLSAGFHYCKQLSPARALEWIYHDSIREKYSLMRQRPSMP